MPSSATSRSCSSSVNGRPLVWLDNAATTQKPQAVIDRLSYFYEHENSNVHRAAHTLAARATDAYEGARDKVRALHQRAVARKTSSSCAAPPRASTSSPRRWGRRNVNAGDEIVITHLEHHANIVPWQQLARREGRRLRVAPVDDTRPDHPRGVREAAQSAHAHRLGDARSRTRSAPSRRRSEMVAMAHRHGASRARRRRAVGLAHAGRRAGARRRLLRVLRPQDVRPDRHRRRLRHARASSRPCRPGRAAAT